MKLWVAHNYRIPTDSCVCLPADLLPGWSTTRYQCYP